jgi:hypothetical protein
MILSLDVNWSATIDITYKKNEPVYFSLLVGPAAGGQLVKE